MTVTVQIEESQEPPVAEDKTAPKATFEKSYGYGYLYFDRENDNSQAGKAYVDAITEISVNDKAFSEPSWGYYPDSGEYVLSSSGYQKYVSFNEKDISTTDDTTIVIKATGYKDLTVVIDKDGNVTTSSPNDDATLKEVPAYQKFDNDAIGYNGYKQIVFSSNGENEVAVTPYLNAISGVTVGSETYSKVDGRYQMGDNNYCISTGNMAYIGLSSNAFAKEGDTTITIKADGYKDLVVTIDKNGDIVE